MNNQYEKLKAKLSQLADINFSAAVLGWDQEVNLPENAKAIRAQQLSTLSGLAYEAFINDEMRDLLEELNSNNDLSEKEKVNVKQTKKYFDKQIKKPKDFVVNMSKAISKAYFAWHEAKEKKDFKIFEKDLDTLIQLKKEEAEMLGYEDHIYDALLDQYEPNAKVKELDVLFADVKQNMVSFVKEITEQQQVDDSFLYQHFEKDKQWGFGIDLLKQMGYDFKSGRQDISAHPFTTNFGSTDVRVTTRIDENNLSEMIWSCIHEGGHALYEQGLRIEDYGLPTGNAISLGIHESQSRLWENNVGRSLPYWRANMEKLHQLFPEHLGNISAEDFYKASNKVSPSLIRTNADELTYHFHILIRYEIEKALMEGNIKTADLPEVWNQKYKEYMNIDVPSVDKGVLQDIHWSHGSFGYFPTYSLGSFYAAQFYKKAEQDIADLSNKIENGNMIPLLDWLRTNVHEHGQLYTADELCERITGEKLNFKYFMDYARQKYAGIYDVEMVLS